MKRYAFKELHFVETADKTAESSAVLSENIRQAPQYTKPCVIFKLYGMSLVMDETAGKLIVTNSILKNPPAGNFLEIHEDYR